MSDPYPEKKAALSVRNVSFFVMLTFAVFLSIVCCALILLIPTSSINVDTVYEGF